MRWHPEPRIIIEQLNESQWEATYPNGNAHGVSNWVEVISHALLSATLDGHAVESIALDGSSLMLMHASRPLEATR